MNNNIPTKLKTKNVEKLSLFVYLYNTLFSRYTEMGNDRLMDSYNLRYTHFGTDSTKYIF